MRRWERILSSLDKLDYATRRQLQAIHDLKSDKNAYRILSEMESEKLINSVRREQKIYYLTKKGRQYVGSSKDVPGKQVIEHILMRNQLYIRLGCPGTWRTERPISLKDSGVRIVPDAMYNVKNLYYFIEVDRSQPMSENRKKIDQYTILKDAFLQQFGEEPILLFYVMTDNRKKAINAYAHGKIRCKIYTTEDVI